MQLRNLAILHADMTRQSIAKCKFDFQFRTLNFAVIYLAESFPYTVLFGCRAHNLFFVLDVRADYIISAYLGENYERLLDALRLRPDPSNPFSPRVFFEAFDEATPLQVSLTIAPTLYDVAALSRDIDAAHKVYFIGWAAHDGIASRPTERNLEKTRRICGENAHRVCRTNNISSRWTDNPRLAKAYSEPDA